MFSVGYIWFFLFWSKDFLIFNTFGNPSKSKILRNCGRIFGTLKIQRAIHSLINSESVNFLNLARLEFSEMRKGFF